MINGPCIYLVFQATEAPLAPSRKSRRSQAPTPKETENGHHRIHRKAVPGERRREVPRIRRSRAHARVVAFWRSVQNRRSVAKLLDWDDHMLRDIGLTAGDVRSVMATPVGDDPSFRLSVLSVERRAAVRAAARERVSRAGLAPESRPSFRDAERGTKRRRIELLDFETWDSKL